MEKEFVPYELALRLKALGFDEPCFGFHSKIHGLMMVKTSGSSSLYKDAGECLAPTYSAAFRWFREEYNLKSFIQPIPDDVDTYIFAYGTKEIEHDDLEYLTHEEAELACLEKLIEICSSK